ncbi:MAG: anti-sigma factor antagonist [Deltaproteobacteria bacterium]|nr:MAG: anti-sigma factor antagonist [Deltaproteobacteria bacterium]
MTIERVDAGQETRVSISGTLDALTAPDVRKEIPSIVETGKHRVIVDLSGLTLIDSSGVAAIVSLYKQVRARGGEFKVVGVRDQPLAIFKLLRMDRVFSL